MRWRLVLGNLIVFVGMVVVLAIGGEIILRAMEGKTDDRPLRTATADPFVPRLIPGAVALRSGVEVRVNELGLRDDPVAEPKPPGLFRVLCVGDSYTFGTGVDQDATIPAVLEKALRETAGPDGSAGSGAIEVVNLGIDGANAYENMIRIEKVGVPLEPDLVILLYLFNDVHQMERGIPWHEKRRYDPVATAHAHRRLRRESTVIRFLAPRVGGILRSLLGRETGKLAVWNVQYQEDVPAWNVTRQAIRRSRDSARAAGASFVLALLPALDILIDSGYPLPLYRQAVASFCRDEGIAFVDLHAPLWGGSGRKYWINPLDPHPDAEACSLLARYLAAELRALNVVPG